MAAKTTKDSMGWLKLNVGLFGSETAGLSDTHIAIYIKLLVVYWTSGNRLPEIDHKLHRRLGVIDSAGEVALAEILNEFFPFDSDGNYSHIELDRQLNETKARSREQSERARKPRGISNKASEEAHDEDDF